jgi:hypothetical protein
VISLFQWVDVILINLHTSYLYMFVRQFVFECGNVCGKIVQEAVRLCPAMKLNGPPCKFKPVAGFCSGGHERQLVAEGTDNFAQTVKKMERWLSRLRR